MGGEFQVNTYTTDSQRIPSVTALADGSFVVTWESYLQDGSNYGIYAQRFSLNAVPIGTLVLTGTGGNDTITAGWNVSLVEGLEGDDTLAATGEGNDVTLRGGAGNDILTGGEWSNGILDGGAGTDTADYANAGGDSLTVTASGDDLFVSTYYGYTDTLRSIETLRLASGDIQVNRDANGAVILTGDGGDTMIQVGAGIAQVEGGAGNDTFDASIATQAITLDGGAGNDTLTGGAGDDILDGGSGRDVAEFWGGMGDYRFSSDGSAVFITDLVNGGSGTDTLRDIEEVRIGWERAVTIGRHFRVNTTTEGSQNSPAVVALQGVAAGDTVAVWHSTGPDGVTGLYGQRYAADGTAVGGEFQVDAGGTAGGEPILAALADGGFVVAWGNADAEWGGDALYARRYGADGTPAGEPFQIPTKPETSLEGSVLTAFQDGGFLVGWGENDWSAPLQIYAQRYDASGGAGEVFRLDLPGIDSETGPALAPLADGGFVMAWVAWEETAGQAAGQRITYGQIYDAANQPAGGMFTISAAASDWYENTHPALATLADGSFVVTWTSSGYDNQASQFLSNIQGQRYTRGMDGQWTAAAAFPIATGITLYDTDSTIVALEGGGFVVVWEGNDGSDTYYDAGIFGQRYAADGAAVGEAFLVNTHNRQWSVEPGPGRPARRRLRGDVGVLSPGRRRGWPLRPALRRERRCGRAADPDRER